MIYLVLSLVMSACITPVCILLARKLRLVDNSKVRMHPAHTHIGTIPRAGGLPLYLAILVATLVAIPLNKIIISILIASGLLVLVGLLDDKYDLSPYLRLAANIGIAGIAIAGGLGIPFVSNPFGAPIPLTHPQIVVYFFGTHVIWIVADLIAIVWLVGMMNIVNWSKGIDGQLPSFVAVACIFLALIAKQYSPYNIDAGYTKILAQIVAGAFLGFWPWNFPPQKIMPGYGGGTLAGFMLGVLTILAFGKVGTLLLVLSIPLLDGFYTLIRRFRSGNNPFKGDANHLHHLLLRRGWSKRAIVFLYCGVSIVCGVLNLIVPNMMVKLITIFAVYTVLFAWVYKLSLEDKQGITS